jgi:hypothetical protein
MSATGQVPQRGIRHTITTKQQAVRWSQAGWTDAWIGVSRTTVGRWVKPSREAKFREDSERTHAQRAAERGKRPLGHYLARAEYKFARMQALHGAGLSCNAIAKVMRFDFGDRWLTEHKVRHALASGRYPKERANA